MLTGTKRHAGNLEYYQLLQQSYQFTDINFPTSVFPNLEKNMKRNEYDEPS